jgi:hypothetical protein
LESDAKKSDENEAEQVQRGADHRDLEGAGSWDGDGGCMPSARDQHGDLLQLEVEVRRLEVSEAKRLRALEEENTRLKKLLAETMLDNAVLKDLASKKWCRPARSEKLSPMPVSITG